MMYGWTHEQVSSLTIAQAVMYQTGGKSSAKPSSIPYSVAKTLYRKELGLDK